jgi:hypothetical protein
MHILHKSTLFLIFGLCLWPPPHARAQHGWSVALFVGRFADNQLLKILFEGDSFDLHFEDSYIVTLSVAKEFARWKRYIAFELEGQVGKHWGLQDHWEFNAALVFRWLLFPWDRYLDTSFAFGEGLSYATDEPFIEGEFLNTKTVKFMNYVLLELEFRLPRVQRWSLITRMHHRSGIFGFFGTGEGSNFLGLGLRYKF